MSAIPSGGRYPAYGLVREYYAREDFLSFLLKTMSTRRVVLVIPEQQHWEPRWDDNRVRGTSVEEVRALILERLDQAFGDAPLEDRLPFYPSFHQSLEHWHDAEASATQAGRDGVLESDQPTWRESFHDVLTLVDVLRRERVPHRIKFSGHRSLHVAIPFAGTRIKASQFGGSGAHSTQLLRMPYSLNEDTGLVSLPLSWDRLPAFRPWQATIPLVDECSDAVWPEPPAQEERERVNEFIRGLAARGSVPRREYFPATSLVAAREQLEPRGLPDDAKVHQPRHQAWAMLWGRREATTQRLQALLDAPDRDARWLAAEAYLRRGERFPAEQIPRLLDTDDPYLRAATVDLLERFTEESCAFFVQALQRPELGAQARWLHLLAQCSGLRNRVVQRVSAATGGSDGFSFRVACITGVHLTDWPGAWRIVERVPADAAARLRATRTRALQLIETIAQSWGKAAIANSVKELVALGPDVIDLILLAQSTPTKRLARAFLRVLADLGDERGLDALIDALGRGQSGAIAVRGLTAIGAPAVPALLEAAASDDLRTRQFALRSLAFLGDPRGWPALSEALHDPDRGIRKEGARGMRAPAPPELEGLCHVARCQEEEDMNGSGYAAVLALATHGEAGMDAIHRLLNEERNLFAAAYLTQHGDEQARAVLRQALDESPERQVQATALWAGLTPDADVTRAMVAGMSGLQRWRRAMVYRILAASDLPEAIDALITDSRNSDSVIRRRAAEALGTCRSPRVLPIIIDLAVDTHAKVRARGLEAALAQGAAILPVLADRLTQEGPRSPLRRALEALQLCVATKARVDAGEPFTLELVTRVASSPKPLWDAARRRVAADQSGQDVEQLAPLLAQVDTTMLRFCIEQLIAAGRVAEDDDGEAAKDDEEE